MNQHPLRIAILLTAATCSTLVFAEDKADGLWRGNGGAALSATSGNSQTTSLLLNGDAARATAIDKISFGAAINYGKSKVNGVDQTTSNKWLASGEYDYNLSPRTFAFGKLGLEADKLVDLSLRTQLAAGLGYKLVNNETTTFDLFGGLGYAIDKYSMNQSIGGKTASRFTRASVYLGEASSHKLSSTVSFKQRLDLYPGLSGDKAVLVKFNAGLSVAMNSSLSLNVGLTDSYNSKPPVGTKANDVGLFTGINVRFGAN